MQKITVVFLLSEIKGGEGPNLVYEYQDGALLPKLGESVYFGTPDIGFQIGGRSHFYQEDGTLRIIYNLQNPSEIDEDYVKCLNAPLFRLG